MCARGGVPIWREKHEHGGGGFLEQAQPAIPVVQSEDHRGLRPFVRIMTSVVGHVGAQRLRDVFNNVGLRPKIISTGDSVPLRRVPFSLRGQRKGTKRKAAPMSRCPSGGSLRYVTAAHPCAAALRAPTASHRGLEERSLCSLKRRFAPEDLTFRRGNSEHHDIGRILRTRMPRRAPQSESDEARRGRARDGAPSTPGQEAPSWTPDSDCGAQGTAEGGAASGRPFFGVLFFGRAKKSTSSQGGENPRLINLRAKPHIIEDVT